MFFTKSLVALLAAGSSALAITITSPSQSAYWVQNTSNVIAWTFNSGDTNPIDITVTNSNNSFLNGIFSIARGVDLTNGSFTVTNVTLVAASGYVVNFVNGTNQSQIFASSGEFDVRTSGTNPASVSIPAPSPTATTPTSGSASGTAASASGTGTPAPSPEANAAAPLIADGVVPIALSAAMALFGGIVAM
ncbi:hypothetical protein BDN71DRAFT_1467174 [Pleurotus eryngii]|uniref:Yeast cell wall synthesis Kre9/Knh1-like N-terminal domain-containing protein n=1 Tax=Pleurotus eryngii TaxID=5323 RepID=A0A9P6A3A4_PLEER|nr:hypothetical protein BDN71DRAFT_1467174 [Pleurotus eryngii]